MPITPYNIFDKINLYSLRFKVTHDGTGPWHSNGAKGHFTSGKYKNGRKLGKDIINLLNAIASGSEPDCTGYVQDMVLHCFDKGVGTYTWNTSLPEDY